MSILREVAGKALRMSELKQTTDRLPGDLVVSRTAPRVNL